MKCLQKDAQSRYSSAEMLAADLRDSAYPSSDYEQWKCTKEFVAHGGILDPSTDKPKSN
jgi:hypothetical protein